MLNSKAKISNISYSPHANCSISGFVSYSYNRYYEVALFIRGIGDVNPWENIITYEKIFSHQSQKLIIGILKKDGSIVVANMYINPDGNLVSDKKIEDGDAFTINYRIYFSN